MKVLVVENHIPDGEGYVDALEQAGMDVWWAENAAEARSITKEHAPHAALVDMGIQDDPASKDPKLSLDNPENGLRLVYWLEAFGSVHVFALSGNTVQELQRRIPCIVFEKPIEDFEEEVVDVLRALEIE